MQGVYSNKVLPTFFRDEHTVECRSQYPRKEFKHWNNEFPVHGPNILEGHTCKEYMTGTLQVVVIKLFKLSTFFPPGILNNVYSVFSHIELIQKQIDCLCCEN